MKPMNDPQNDKTPCTDFHLDSVKWIPDANRLDFTVKIVIEKGGMEFRHYSIEFEDRFWNELLPDNELDYVDENGMVSARMDNYFNLHFQGKNAKGNIVSQVRRLKPFLENVAARIFNDWQ